MREKAPQEMAAKLLAPVIGRDGPVAAALTDPIADTPMVVTLEQLRPYDHDPRVTRNPRWNDLKASIRERGLDAPPPITRRPGELHYIIRNGGNTRLSILRELWSETKEERFFRLACLFRPWSARGEIIALTGHLAENELRGNLSFIERALGVAKANELYEHESGTTLSQSELARRLSADGYPITQSHISRMQDTVRYLLPAIPQILYTGLGKPQIERLATLRKNASRAWEQHAPAAHPTVEFATLFQDVLASFDSEPEAFSVQRAQDELLGQMADLLATDYDTLALEIADSEARHLVLSHDPSPPQLMSPSSLSSPVQISHASTHNIPTHSPAGPARVAPNPIVNTPRGGSSAPQAAPSPVPPEASASRQRSDQHDEDRIAQHILSPIQTTDRLAGIQRTIADATGDAIPDFRSNVLQAIPVQAGGLHPISDIWYIDAGLDAVDRLQVHIAQLAREIAAEASIAECIESVPDGVGFSVRPQPGSPTPAPFMPRAVLTLLSALSAPYVSGDLRRNPDGLRLADDLGPLLQGRPAQNKAAHLTRLSDVAVVKLFRLIRLARRLLELQSDDASSVGRCQFRR
jgi:ParB family protein of integrating conjugative element (PFGI_1 class)